MELTINTKDKTVLFKGRVNIKELLDELESLGISLYEYSIEGQVTIIRSSEPNTPWPIPNTPINPWKFDQPINPMDPTYPYRIGDFPGIQIPYDVRCHVCYVGG